LFAITLLGEPLRAGLVVGTVAVVGGGVALVSTRSRAARLTAAGVAAGVVAAGLISARDNFVRWADTGNSVPGVVAAAALLVAVTRSSRRTGSSSRRKRRKKKVKTAKKTSACSVAIVIPAISWSVSAERPQSRSGACS